MCDRKLIIGIGIGMIISSVVMTGVKINANYDKSVIEQKARDLGMQYPDEMRVIRDKEAKTK
ncbi:hypothetical protein ACFIJ5_11455 [Haloimpatiens sp. FM7330]|uniref:hypothetical protein n=1 Tax=Haloimpatiens sp. FM7330 TaxID=3298610 RepID=UPI003640FBDD